MREYFSSIQSIDVKYQHWTTICPDDKPHDGECGPQLAEWAEQGSQKFLKTEPYPNEGLKPTRIYMTFDGNTGYYVDDDPHDISKIRSILQTPQINSTYETALHFTPAAFYGRRVPFWEKTLLELLLSPSATVVAREIISGAEVIHLRIANERGDGNIKATFDIWLDEQRDLLPRRLVVKVTDGPEVPKLLQNAEWRNEVREFLAIEDALLKKKRWFPAEMTQINLLGKWRLKVESATINHQLSRVKFRPDIPVGTLIHDGDPIPGTSPKTYVFGGTSATSTLIDNRLEEAARLPVPSSLLVDARREQSLNWSLIIGGISLGLLLVVVIWRFVVWRL